jgi:hypothetical protein
MLQSNKQPNPSAIPGCPASCYAGRREQSLPIMMLLGRERENSQAEARGDRLSKADSCVSVCMCLPKLKAAEPKQSVQAT